MKKPGLAAIILSGVKKDKEEEGSEEESSSFDIFWDAVQAKDKEEAKDALGAYIHECMAEYEESEHEEG